MKPIGIDLGTTNSAVAVFERGIPKVIPVFGHKITPSVVSWNPKNNQIVVGYEAKNRALIHPETTVVSNKRFMGDSEKKYNILGNTYTPIDIASFLLDYLAKGASEFLGKKVKDVVVTVPAYFNAVEKENTLLAANKAGLNVVMLQQEPTAAAITYGLDQEKNQTILVYDLGGGTFDISVLQVIGNSFKVIAIGGDNHLGGDSFDDALSDYIFTVIKQEIGVDLKNDQSSEAIIAKGKIKEEAERVKKTLSLSKSEDFDIVNIIQGYSISHRVTRKKYEEVIRPFIVRSIDLLRQTLQEAGLTPEDINRVLCVGGSTKTPLVIEMLTHEVKKPYIAPNVDEIVALGAAITALGSFTPGLKNEKISTKIQFQNVTSQALGIRLEKDGFGIVIPKNTPIPISLQREFTTSYDFATETDIEVFQGIHTKCNNNIALGGFLLKGLKKAKAGEPRVAVNFTLNESDILGISAKDLSTNVTNNLVIEKFRPKKYSPNENQNNYKKIKIGVSDIGCDNMGAILSAEGYPWEHVLDFTNYESLQKFSILFINCMAGGSAISNQYALREYVNNGGTLYVSDLSADNITQAFPGYIEFGNGGVAPQNITAKIINAEAQAILGTRKVKIHFDLSAWVPITSVSRNVEIILEGKVNCSDLGLKNRILMASFQYGKGNVIYTAFHNHAKPSADEKNLLKLIALKPIAMSTKTPLRDLIS
jgi:molecular chaperone DnaK